MARPVGTGKPEGEKYIKRSFTCPPDLWAQVQAHIPERERSALIQGWLRREVARRKREGTAENTGGEAE
jgi:hypothetical protein